MGAPRPHDDLQPLVDEEQDEVHDKQDQYQSYNHLLDGRVSLVAREQPQEQVSREHHDEPNSRGQLLGELQAYVGLVLVLLELVGGLLLNNVLIELGALVPIELVVLVRSVLLVLAFFHIAGALVFVDLDVGVRLVRFGLVLEFLLVLLLVVVRLAALVRVEAFAVAGSLDLLEVVLVPDGVDDDEHHALEVEQDPLPRELVLKVNREHRLAPVESLN